jgi:hypothetical protein
MLPCAECQNVTGTFSLFCPLVNKDCVFHTYVYCTYGRDIFKHFRLLPFFRRRLSFFWGEEDVKKFCVQGCTFQNILEGCKIFWDQLFMCLHFGVTFWRILHGWRRVETFLNFEVSRSSEMAFSKSSLAIS